MLTFLLNRDRWGLRTTVHKHFYEAKQNKPLNLFLVHNLFVYTLQLLWKDWSFRFPTSFTVTAFQAVSMFSGILFQKLIFIRNFCLFNILWTFLCALPLDICFYYSLSGPKVNATIFFLFLFLESQCLHSEACYHTTQISWFMLMSNTDTQTFLSQ